MAVAAKPPFRVLVLLVTIAVATLLLLASAGNATAPSRSMVTHQVEAGDTLWRIASAHTDPGGDIRRVVDAIRRASDLHGSLIRPGDVLVIPLES